MSNEKFTQGEWLVIKDADLMDKIITTKDRISNLKPPICCIDTLLTESIANAHLIAAAPDMYRMLKNIEEDSSQVNVITIRRLLAKARGKL